MDSRVSTMASGDPPFDAGYADFGPEAAEMCEIWRRIGKEPGSKEDRGRDLRSSSAMQQRREKM